MNRGDTAAAMKYRRLLSASLAPLEAIELAKAFPVKQLPAAPKQGPWKLGRK